MSPYNKENILTTYHYTFANSGHQTKCISVDITQPPCMDNYIDMLNENINILLL